MQMPPAPSADALTFEKALEELEALVHRMEDGKLPLEESPAAYQRGTELSSSASPGSPMPRRASPSSKVAAARPHARARSEQPPDFPAWSREVAGRMEAALTELFPPSSRAQPAARRDALRDPRVAASGCAPCWVRRRRAGGGDARAPAHSGRRAVELIHAYSLIHDDLPCRFGSNPVLREDRPERAEVEGAAGWDVAFDGMEIRL